MAGVGDCLLDGTDQKRSDRVAGNESLEQLEETWCSAKMSEVRVLVATGLHNP
jgi:hypothetical protein